MSPDAQSAEEPATLQEGREMAGPLSWARGRRAIRIRLHPPCSHQPHPFPRESSGLGTKSAPSLEMPRPCLGLPKVAPRPLTGQGLCSGKPGTRPRGGCRDPFSSSHTFLCVREWRDLPRGLAYHKAHRGFDPGEGKACPFDVLTSGITALLFGFCHNWTVSGTELWRLLGDNNLGKN